MGVLFFQPCAFDFGADQEANGGNELDFAVGLGVGLAMLNVDDADEFVAGKDRHGKKGFVFIFRQLVEALETGVLKGARRYGDRLQMLGNPTGDALPHLHFQAVDDFGMRIFRGAEDQFFGFEDVNEAGVTFYDGTDEIDDALQDFVKRIGSRHAAANLMEKTNRRILQGKDRLVHGGDGNGRDAAGQTQRIVRIEKGL